MDATEVTLGEYMKFVAAGNPPAQTGVCDWNGNSADAGEADADAGASPDALSPRSDCLVDAKWLTDDLPVVCIDWCDAKAYCQSVGKDLCHDSYSQPDVVEQSDWFAVCSSNGAFTHVYGNNYVAGKCQAICGSCIPKRPASFEECQVSGIFDLEGNVAEWTDACQTVDDNAQCLTRGGSVATNAEGDLACEKALPIPRNEASASVGFRCCAYPGTASTQGG